MGTGSRLLLLAVLIALGLSAFLFTRPSPPILIGFSGPLTGMNSDLGVQGRNGAQLAIEHINARGGIAGRPLEMRAKDDGPTAETARAADAALLAQGVVAIIGHMTSNQSLAGLPVVEHAGGVMISPTASTPLLSGRPDGFFRVIPDSRMWTAKLAAYAVDRGIRSVSIIYETANASFSSTFADGFADYFVSHGGILSRRIPFTSTERASLEEAAQLAVASRSEAIILSASARDTAALAQRIAALSPQKPQLFSSSWAYTREIFLAGGRDVEGIIFCLSYLPDDTREGYLAFHRAYSDRFGWPPNFAAGFSYEAVLVLADALARTKGGRHNLRAALAEGRTVPGISDPLTIDRDGDIERTPVIVTIRNGEFVTLQ